MYFGKGGGDRGSADGAGGSWKVTQSLNVTDYAKFCMHKLVYSFAGNAYE